MKDLIPSEADFEVLMSALMSHEKELARQIVVNEALGRVDLTNAETFEKAFSDPHQSLPPIDAKRVIREVMDVQEKLTLVKARLIEFRNFVRDHKDKLAIEDLLK